jgi:hypothetical protein
VIKIRNHETELCLNADGKNLVTVKCERTRSQLWIQRNQKVINVQTGQCLDSNDVGNAYVHDCNEGNYQNWLVHQNDSFLIQNAQTKRFLDSNANGQVELIYLFPNHNVNCIYISFKFVKVYTLPANNGNNQNWKVYAS